jgi:hypothetical protein
MKIYQRGFINYRSPKEQKLPKGNLTERLIIDFIIKVLKPGLVAHLQELDSHSRGEEQPSLSHKYQQVTYRVRL